MTVCEGAYRHCDSRCVVTVCEEYSSSGNVCDEHVPFGDASIEDSRDMDGLAFWRANDWLSCVVAAREGRGAGNGWLTSFV